MFAAKNKAQYEIVTSWKWWKRDEARKKLTGKGAMEVAVGGKLKKVFGADVSQKANTEVLAHTAAFGAMFKAAPEASAQQLVPLVVISLLKLAFTYDQASSDAKRQAIQQVVDPLKKWSDFWVFMKKVWPVLLKAERSVTKTTKFLDDLKKDAAFAGNIKRWNNRKKRRRVKRRHR